MTGVQTCALPICGASPKRDAPQEPGEPNADRERERRQQKARKKCRDPAQGVAERDRRSFQMRRDKVIEGERAGAAEDQESKQRHPEKVISKFFIGELQKGGSEKHRNGGEAGCDAEHQKNGAEKFNAGPDSAAVAGSRPGTGCSLV